MAAPTPSTRVAPTGIYLKNGYRSLITFSADTDISIWEKGVQPPGVDGGDAIDTTTQHNNDWRTMTPRALMKGSDSKITFAYDPAAYTQLLNLVNVEQTITERFPDSSTLCYYGFVKDFEFNPLQEGEFPEGSCTIVPTHFDPTNNVEAGPVLTSVTGT